MTDILAFDRFKAAIAALVREMFPRLDYYGLYEYQVIAGTGLSGFELRSTTTAMPDLQGVTFYPRGAATTTAPGVIAVGDNVLVGFVNGDPTRPVILHDPAIARAGELFVFPTPSAAPLVRA